MAGALTEGAYVNGLLTSYHHVGFFVLDEEGAELNVILNTMTIYDVVLNHRIYRVVYITRKIEHCLYATAGAATNKIINKTWRRQCAPFLIEN